MLVTPNNITIVLLSFLIVANLFPITNFFK